MFVQGENADAINRAEHRYVCSPLGICILNMEK